MVESNTSNLNLHKVTPIQLEQYMIDALENHAKRVARWKLGSKAEVRSDILRGMWCIWQNVSYLTTGLTMKCTG
ncbi:hypothetical protein PILCRDRAFT_829980 [Piloderma croceum F 1598]|uniref:Uncharacterized protein n=1 Tax=Piloderma croceum (strain F 1598) TaxID=765440 RepID=A0A0C3AED3_PILCF|nr:hypothetical protein PILCRDRAFT_829980 [Piloderma croceum F 1598]